MTTADARTGRTDALAAAGTAVVAIGLLVGLPGLAGSDAGETTGSFPAPFALEWILFALVLLAQSAVLLAATRHRLLVPVAVAALAVAACAVSPGDLHTLAELAVVVAVVLAVARLPLGRLWPTLAATGALVVVAEITAAVVESVSPVASALGGGTLQAIGTVGFPLLVALVVRSRRDVGLARRAEASAVGREQDALVDAAVSRERVAMARELHDIAAHHLSGIALMAAVIDRQIDSEPEQAHLGARQVREQSTAVLDDLRRLVGLLRDDGEVERAVESILGIVDLVERVRTGSDTRLEILTEGDRRLVGSGVGPLAQLAAYRTVQEALANAALHAPGARCVVTIDDLDSMQVTVRIENRPPAVLPRVTSAVGGNGLRGMRERADLVGALLHASPTGDGGWQVELTLDRQTPAASIEPTNGGTP